MADGSTNAVDQLLGHTAGPTEPVTDRDVTRARSSAYIVHGNFAKLVALCDDATTGLIRVDQETPRADVENEVYRRLHNYVAALYSYDEQIRTILNRRLPTNVGKHEFLPDRGERGAPRYVRRGLFLRGLRNDFQHGDYWCLSITSEGTDAGDALYHLRFSKESFEPTPRGGLDEAGAYLAHANDEELEFPLAYVGTFHRQLFNEFEEAFESWCARNRAAG